MLIIDTYFRIFSANHKKYSAEGLALCGVLLSDIAFIKLYCKGLIRT